MQNSRAPVALQRTSGRGRIVVKQSAGRTRIDQLYQEGAARIRVPDRSHVAGLEAVIINTAGGMTSDDDLTWQAQAGQSTHLTVTTQACEKVYKADGTPANVAVELKIAEHAQLNWLPQETILFDKAQLSRTITAHLEGDAKLLLVEPIIFGRRAMRETMQTGLWRDRWRIFHQGTLVHGENVRLEGDVASHLNSLAGLGGHTTLATLALIGSHAEGKLEGARSCLANISNVIGGASHWTVEGTSKLIIRMAAPDGYTLRQALIPLINQLASSPEEKTGGAVPKIWSL
ncbi:MAG: urease accessory protein UreD [Hyphomicrobiales bacterium]